MIALPIVCFVLGFLIIYRFVPAIPSELANYVALSILAGFDALVGGLRARLEGRFDEAVFVSGFFVNMVLAGLLAYFGDKLNVDLYLAVTVALGIRVFNNLGRIRGLLVTHRAGVPMGGSPTP
jgi:small basic protein